MTTLIDTNVAIHLRDGDSWVLDRYSTLAAPPALSIVSRVELEGGIVARPELAAGRRAALDIMMRDLDILDFDAAAAIAYGRIISATGYSRARILDRMIAATAMVHGLTLITINGADFRDIPDLKLEIWTA